jgi:bifunctional DNA-binding transcriptional regulator/antitoxin component of YhaV-PrlF toxin-antitoxin module
LAKAYSKLNSKNQVLIPRAICRELKIKPDETLELVVSGPQKVKKLVLTKIRR